MQKTESGKINVLGLPFQRSWLQTVLARQDEVITPNTAMDLTGHNVQYHKNIYAEHSLNKVPTNIMKLWTVSG